MHLWGTAIAQAGNLKWVSSLGSCNVERGSVSFMASICERAGSSQSIPDWIDTTLESYLSEVTVFVRLPIAAIVSAGLLVLAWKITQKLWPISFSKSKPSPEADDMSEIEEYE